ncbi:MAG: DUF2804 domain-containing protein [Acidimicrobiia bacterium]|nr:DUF2804 domain-containing protein [Acidimicrobiia bacterium]
MVDVERTHEPEITHPVQQCLPDGRLNPEAVGWSRHPLHDCNLLGRWGRKKRWEYWCVTTDTHMFSLTFADIDYFGLAAVGFMPDYTEARITEKVGIVPFGLGMAMPPTAGVGALSVRTPGLKVVVNRTESATLLRSTARTVGSHRIEVDLRIETPPGHETLNVLVPWSEHLFQFTSKQNCLPVEGTVVCDGTAYEFGPHNSAFGCQDFGRGVWPYRTAWNWASASGRLTDGTVLGITLGGKWTDRTGVTENGIVVDGRLHKLGEDLDWEYDRRDFERPWRIRAPRSGRVDLEFVPFCDRAATLDLGVLSTRVHQCFGRFHGTVVSDDGDEIAVTDLLGWAEEHIARW